MWPFILAVHKSFKFHVSTVSYKVRKLESTAIYTNKQWLEQMNIEFVWSYILAVHKSFEFHVSTGSYKVRKLKSTAMFSTNKGINK